jgi:predicted O-methyltransferase YrrM
MSKKTQNIVNKALTCRGWTQAKKLFLLYHLVKRTKKVKGDILEIGSAYGRSSILLCLSSKKTVWSIDPHTGGRVIIERKDRQNSYHEFLDNLKRFKIKNIRVLKYTTEEVIRRGLIPSSVKFSLVFIDGLHTPKGVTIDFNLAYPKLQKGGIMVLDDYFGNIFQDYARAIDKLVSITGINLQRDKENGVVYFEKNCQTPR